MSAPKRSGFALVWLVFAMPFLGCAHWAEGLNALHSGGEIRGRVEIAARALTSPESIEKSSSTENAILVLLEPTTAKFSFGSPWQVQKVAIRTSRHSSGIKLVTADQPIRIQNLDSVHHELFTTNTDDPLRVQLAGNSESEVFRLVNPGLIRFYCVLHPDENYTFISRSSSTYHAFVDSGMRFRIPDVRPGRYRVRAASALDWGESEMVEIVTDETVLLTLRLAPGLDL